MEDILVNVALYGGSIVAGGTLFFATLYNHYNHFQAAESLHLAIRTLQEFELCEESMRRRDLRRSAGDTSVPLSEYPPLKKMQKERLSFSVDRVQNAYAHLSRTFPRRKARHALLNVATSDTV